MVRFAPFPGIRAAQAPDISDLASPPYDVIGPQDRLDLEERSPVNSVRLDFPRDEEGVDRYVLAAGRLAAWLADGTLVRDGRPTLSIYRMTASDPAGRTTVTTGVIGQFGLEPPGTGGILPHEQTTAKDKADRMSLLRACRANLSPIWGLSMTAGLAALHAPEGEPHHWAVDGEGVRHEVWVLDDAQRIAAICDAVGRSPVVVADGHHRFETALVYHAEHPQDHGADALMAFVVEASPAELEVRAIHRIVRATAPGTDLRALFAASCDLVPVPAHEVSAGLAARLTDLRAMALLTPDGAWLASPRPGSLPPSLTLDSERCAHLLGPDAEVQYHHDVTHLVGEVAAGRAAGGVVLRPATVAQIREVAEHRTRMPPKTTFFWPKPRTGMVYRPFR